MIINDGVTSVCIIKQGSQNMAQGTNLPLHKRLEALSTNLYTVKRKISSCLTSFLLRRCIGLEILNLVSIGSEWVNGATHDPITFFLKNATHTHTQAWHTFRDLQFFFWNTQSCLCALYYMKAYEQSNKSCYAVLQCTDKEYCNILNELNCHFKRPSKKWLDRSSIPGKGKASIFATTSTEPAD